MKKKKQKNPFEFETGTENKSIVKKRFLQFYDFINFNGIMRCRVLDLLLKKAIRKLKTNYHFSFTSVLVQNKFRKLHKVGS